MSAAPQPASDTIATAEVTSGAALTPATELDVDSEADVDPELPDRTRADADAVAEDVDVEDAADSADDPADGTGGDEAAPDELLVREGDVAGDYLERLLDILDVDGDIDLDVEGDRASVAIVGGELSSLIGQDGAVLEALQELTRLAVAQETGVRSRLMLDIGAFRAQRRADLAAMAGEAARRVARSARPERLVPMNPFERKVVHDVVATVSGVRSESEGEEPHRRVVVLPEA